MSGCEDAAKAQVFSDVDSAYVTLESTRESAASRIKKNI